ncbi:MAG TPA: hypothetical protein VFH56_14805 [Acidimicrobiales bacterium]|nr:hypothetical protein [Acidimicrobiales bacterium]
MTAPQAGDEDWAGFHFMECDGECGGDCAAAAEAMDSADEFAAWIREALSKPQWN